ncbi:acyl-CoA dehydrogenase [Roseovarius sp. M141]|uniref:acyl-CoA dehydrogenase n=1 Tax=Roseovarius sp. M141 TaxID=2583806 RepID=UPI0020CE6998|nr:acyl-CoA dehydrogenase [Roseovarius sp. M141]MCQ0093967.1 acyl-CoA dehydrogenase [Roseovarius sp. M141]
MTAPKSLCVVSQPPNADQRVPVRISRELRAIAADEERGYRSIACSIDLLRQAGYLTDDGAFDPARTARALMQVGAANLSVGRLWEGHINALHLIRLYGTGDLKTSMNRRIEKGALLGVWGADAEVPVTLDAFDTHLNGRKNFTSGLETVTHAIVTVNSGRDVRLALIDVTDTARADPSTWDMQGMQATASGAYDFTGLSADRIEWVGSPGDYLKEPRFVGGVWRIAALQAGAAAGLLDMAATELRTAGRMNAEAQQSRLISVLMRVWAGMALTERAADATIDREIAPEDIVATSIAARLFTEEVGLDAIRAVEQSIGLRHFEAGSETGRMARDLAVYLRQAARDAFLQRAARTAVGEDGRIWGVFG